MELGEKLSGEAVYRVYFLRLFWQVDRYNMEDIVLRSREGKADVVPPCIVDQLEDIQSYKTKVLLCRWMTADRFERYRGHILASVRNVPDTERLELFMEDHDKATEQSGLNLSLPTTLLRYRPQSGSGVPDRGFELLRILLCYYLVQLDPLGDGDEQSHDLFQRALVQEDYQLVHLIVRNKLYQNWWITEIRVALELSENPAKMWNLLYLMFSQSNFYRLFLRDRPSDNWSFFQSELHNLRDGIEDDIPGACDPIPCFSDETAEEFRQALAKTGDSYWKDQADMITDCLKTRSLEYLPNWIGAGRERRYP